MFKVLVLVASMVAAPAFASTAWEADQETAMKALSKLVAEAGQVKVTGDVDPSETLSGILAEQLLNRGDEKQIREIKCTVVADNTVMTCSLGIYQDGTDDADFSLHISSTFTVNVTYDQKADKNIVEIKELDNEVLIERGT